MRRAGGRLRLAPACRPRSPPANHGLNVLIVEKEARGLADQPRGQRMAVDSGTSLARAWGIVEPADQARSYLRHEAGNSF